MKKKVEIGQNAKINIKWSVNPFDYTKDKSDEIRGKFAKKYGIRKQNITVEPCLIKKKANGGSESITDSVIGDIHDPMFQRKLFVDWINENEIKDYDMSLIDEIDESINSLIDYEKYGKRRNYTVKWVKWDNFLSYGKGNYFDFRELDGLVLLKSEPANQGGKSVFSLDLLRFLLFGKVTSREVNWTLSKVFNRYIPEATEVVVEGCVEIDGNDYVIKRVVSRPQLKRRTEKSSVTQKVYYYKVVNDEYVELRNEDDENMGGDTVSDSNRIIKEAIGNESDFDLMICVNDSNLKSLISLKDTERGRLITRWVGLLPLEEKDKLARDKYNSEVSKSFLSNRYNEDEIELSIKELDDDTKEREKLKKSAKKKLEDTEKAIEDKGREKDGLLKSMENINQDLLKVDVSSLDAQMEWVVSEGKKKRAQYEDTKKQLEAVGEISFNEEESASVDKQFNDLGIEIAALRENVKHMREHKEALIKGEFCPTCGAKLKDVDNSEKIRKLNEEYDNIVKIGSEKKKEYDELKEKKERMGELRAKYNEKLRLGLLADKISVDIDKLVTKYKELKKTQKEIELNKDAIRKNSETEAMLNVINETLKTFGNTAKMLNTEIAEYDAQINSNKKSIDECKKILLLLQKEKTTIRAWKLYMEMVGKNGVCKMVLRKVLPFINAQLKYMLDDVCDFDVSVDMDDRNDVGFTITHNGTSASLASGSGFEKTVASLALRSVLAKVSSFSKPSFVVFDEILGGVSEENYDEVRSLYDRISKDYSFILQISHNKNIYEWHSHVIQVEKKNDVSTISLIN